MEVLLVDWLIPASIRSIDPSLDLSTDWTWRPASKNGSLLVFSVD